MPLITVQLPHDVQTLKSVSVIVCMRVTTSLRKHAVDSLPALELVR